MDATLIRTRAMAAMVVGARGRNALRVVDAFERMRIIVVRLDDVATACDRLPIEMPNVVLVLASMREDERDALADRATAVGALVVNVDPELDDETFNDFIESTVRSAVERRLRRDEQATSNEVDEGWDAEGT